MLRAQEERICLNLGPTQSCRVVYHRVYFPPRALREGISKSSFQRRCQYLAINAHEMAPRTGQRLQERVWDTPTQGLLYRSCAVEMSLLELTLLYMEMILPYVHVDIFIYIYSPCRAVPNSLHACLRVRRALNLYRDPSLIKTRTPLGPYRRPVPRVLCGS